MLCAFCFVALPNAASAARSGKSQVLTRSELTNLQKRVEQVEARYRQAQRDHKKAFDVHIRVKGKEKMQKINEGAQFHMARKREEGLKVEYRLLKAELGEAEKLYRRHVKQSQKKIMAVKSEAKPEKAYGPLEALKKIFG